MTATIDSSTGSTPDGSKTLTRTFRGPKRVGFIDNVRFLADPRGTLHRFVARYGDPFIGYDPAGSVLFIGNPEAVKAVFTADPDVFDVPMRDQLAPFFGLTSLILVTGPKHKKDRKLLAPPFHGSRMRAYGELIVETAKREVAKIPVGKPFAMMDLTQAISLEVILRAIFGVANGTRREHFREAVVRLMEATASPLITMFEFARHEFGGFGPWARFVRARAALDALIYEEIAARRANPAASGEDVLSLMMAARYDDGSAMSEIELRDELHLLLFAGHDTTSTALSWAFYWLHRQPDLRARVIADVAALGDDPTPDAIAALPYLDAVCCETLRIHPIAVNVARLLRKPLDVMGNEIAPGTTVMVSSLLVHDRPELYPDPRVFRPERFLERTFSPHEFVPFGGGSRRCIGAAFAMYEMKLVLTTLLRSERFRLVDDREVKAVVRGLTMGPKGGVKMLREGPTPRG